MQVTEEELDRYQHESIAEDAKRDAAEGYARPPLERVLEDIDLAQVWEWREEVEENLKRLRDRKALIDMELTRRVKQVRPDFDGDTGGSADLVDGDLLVRMTYSRDYEYVADELILLVEEKLLTMDEYGGLVKYEPKVNRTTFNQLVKRGGRVKEVLESACKLRSARPSFESKARS